MNQVSREIIISKADAAERQLRTAIWLWFHDMDPVSIHGLASAAAKVLWRLHEKHRTGYRTFAELLVDRIKPEWRKEVIENFNSTANFIKHGDRDPFAFHSFNPESTFLVMVDAAEALKAFNGSRPVECQALDAWTAIYYPQILNNSPEVKVLLATAESFRGKFSSKSQFYENVYRAVQLNAAQAALHRKPINLPEQPPS